jgi:hypothetical protein
VSALGAVVALGTLAAGVLLGWAVLRREHAEGALLDDEPMAPPSLPPPLQPPSRMELADRSGAPEAPVGFGYKMSWLVVRSDDPAQVVELLDLHDQRPCGWSTGVHLAYDHHGLVFVTPAVQGWVFAIHASLPSLGWEPDEPAWSALMARLAGRFDEVQYFATHRVAEYHAWARFVGGVELRAFAFSADEDEPLADRGEAVEAEGLDGEHGPCEDDVMRVAAAWSMDPTALDELDGPVGVGWIGSPRASGGSA